jgi:hypothetical protein
MNVYKSDPELVKAACKEAKFDTGRDFKRQSIESLKKAWVGIVESTGGSGSPSIDSDHYLERAMYHVEQAIKNLTHE